MTTITIPLKKERDANGVWDIKKAMFRFNDEGECRVSMDMMQDLLEVYNVGSVALEKLMNEAGYLVALDSYDPKTHTYLYLLD